MIDTRYVLPEPLVEVAIAPKKLADQQKLIAALEARVAQDASFAFSFNAETGQTIVRGMSEEHLDASIEALRHACGADVEVGTPQVAYRECIVREVQIDRTHSKVFANGGEFARVVLSFAPGAPGSGFAFENEAGLAVRDDLVPGVIKGLNASRESGVLAGFPLIDLKATLLNGAYHDLDSSAHTFEIAARAALRLLKNEDAIRLLEPIMAVEISGLQQLRDTFIDDLKARRGVIQDDDLIVVRALVPLADMLGYRRAFAMLSRGYGRFTMRYSHHQVTSFGDDDPDPLRPAMAMRLRA